MNIVIRVIACALMFAAAPAYARLTTITITAVEPFAPGTTYGEAGAYERVKGVFKGEIDPQDPRNRIIVNLDKAPRNASGKVEYEADFFMLRPADPARGNGKIIYDVTNRGRLNFHSRFTEAKKRSNDPRTADDVGDGLFFRQGYTFVWNGWDPDAPTRGNGLAMKPVIATNGGAPITRAIRDEFISGTRARDEGDGGSRSEGAVFRLSYEAANLDPSAAKLTVRRTDTAERREIPSNAWQYLNARAIQLLPAGTKAETGSIYEFHYQAKNPRVHEIGVIRDWTKPEIDMAKPYRPLVPQVDADGNETAGVLLPDIAVPLATYTGWNLYRTPYPETEMCDRDGTYVPFARTRAERDARGDPRLSLEERYGSHAIYVKRYEEAVQRLVRERLLLPQDGQRYMARVRGDEVARLFSQPVLGQR